MDWEKLLTGAAPGMLQAGMGMWSGNQAVKEAESRAGQAQAAGQPYSTAALDQLLQAQKFDTGANAQSRYDQQMKLMKPGQENDQLKMMRMLQAKGLLGTSTNAPTTGLEEGTAHNPFVSSLLGAQETARQQAAARALDDSQNTLNAMVSRTSALNNNATGAQQRAQAGQPTASKASMFGEIAKGLGGMLGNKDVMSAIFGAFGGGKGGAGSPSFSQQTSANSNGQWDSPGAFSYTPEPVRYDDWSGADYSGGYDSYSGDDWNLGSGWGY